MALHVDHGLSCTLHFQYVTSVMKEHWCFVVSIRIYCTYKCEIYLHVHRWH